MTDYTILLNATIDASSIQAQLESVASKYSINVEANLDQSQFAALQSQVSTIQDGINTQAKSTMIVDPETNAAALDDLKIQAQNAQDVILSLSKTTSSETFVNGIQTASSETKIWTDDLGNTTKELTNVKYAEDGVATSTKEVTTNVQNLGQANESVMGDWFDQMGSVLQRTIQWSVALAAVYGTFRAFQDGITYVSDLNNAMANTQAITGQTAQQVQTLYTNYQNMAQQLGTTTMDIAQASDMWLRQGKSAQDAGTLTQATIMMTKLGATDAATAASNLTAIMNGFQMSASDAIPVLDKVVTLTNSAKTSAAITFEDLSTAMQSSASIANQTGVSFDQLASYIATISTVTQVSAESTGNSL